MKSYFENRILLPFLGILLCVSIGVISTFIAEFIPLGAVTISIILGIIINNTVKINKGLTRGITFSEKNILAIAIAFMGLNLNYSVVDDLGLSSLLIVVSALILTIGFSLILARLFNLQSKWCLLIGIGSGVCGSSAIAATKDIIGVEEGKAGVSIAMINALGTVGIFLMPLLSKVIFHFSAAESGFFIGNVLQAVGQVAAAGFSISHEAGTIATVVKMVRILLLTPIIMILLLVFQKRSNRVNLLSKIPIYILGFIIFSLISTFQLVPDFVIDSMKNIGKFLLIAAMAGIGLKISLIQLFQNGKTVLLVGVILFVFQILYSSIIIIFCM